MYTKGKVRNEHVRQASKLEGPAKADEEARRQAAHAEQRYRSIALSNYKRCLQVSIRG